MKQIPQLDQIDCDILRHLQAHAKLTNAQMAQDIGLSPAATLERVRRLENQGVIEGYHAKLKPTQLALCTCVMLHVTLQHLSTASVAAFQKTMTRIPEVVECHQVVGDADFLVKVIASDIVAYQQVVMHHFSAVEGIQHMKAFVITATLKEAGITVMPHT